MKLVMLLYNGSMLHGDGNESWIEVHIQVFDLAREKRSVLYMD